MPSSPRFLDDVMQMLALLEGITSRSMFGGYGIFSEGDMFALISGSEFFLKVDDSNRTLFEEAGSKRYGRMPYYLVPAEVLEDRDKLLDWARASIAIARAAPKKRH